MERDTQSWYPLPVHIYIPAVLCLRFEQAGTVERQLPTLLCLRLLWEGFHGWSDSRTPSGGKKKKIALVMRWVKIVQGGGSSLTPLSAYVMGTNSHRPQATWSHLTQACAAFLGTRPHLLLLSLPCGPTLALCPGGLTGMPKLRDIQSPTMREGQRVRCRNLQKACGKRVQNLNRLQCGYTRNTLLAVFF